ncbi:esterase E4-like [Zerene cesonia]|uniref:esterase E4-like n=1 Tax=Zerene cesonia TaxID=33412 RepID=UPI0018E5867A|nr:esterase E4-like [Zerene cesonia]
MFGNVLILVALITVVNTENLDVRVVNTDQGPVKGYKLPNENVYSFLSIPYATAPTGLDRFKAPLPAPTWTEPFEAVEETIMCPQGTRLTDGSKNQEQCLVASVYAPNTTLQNLPVLVYVHGGAYISGYGNSLTPKNLVEIGNIVAVTFNYRLGVHGFLCLGTEAAPGNSGIKDQVALLKWVQKNIANFGGNPKDVTIAGYSAGSSSVDLLMISKLAQGLFNKVIPESTQGLFNKVIPESSANVQAYSVQKNPIENAKWYARQLNFRNFNDMKALEEFYLTTPLNVLSSVDVIRRSDHTTIFSPCIERDIGQEIFLSDSPVNILSSGNYTKYPMLYGFSDMEGLYRVPYFDEWKYRMNDNFAEFLPHDLRFANEEERQEQAQRIRDYYFDDEPIGNNNILRYIDYLSDCMFAYPLLRAAKLHALAGNNRVYLYEYSFVDDDTEYIPHTNQRGATHCAQTRAVLDLPDENIISKEFREMKRRIREIWLNFIKYGEPVPKESSLPAWPPITADNLSYMSLNTTMEYKDRLLYERAQFWEQIYDKYYQGPSPPNPEANNLSVRPDGTSVFCILLAVHFFCFLSRIA